MHTVSEKKRGERTKRIGVSNLQKQNTVFRERGVLEASCCDFEENTKGM